MNESRNQLVTLTYSHSKNEHGFEAFLDDIRKYLEVNAGRKGNRWEWNYLVDPETGLIRVFVSFLKSADALMFKLSYTPLH
jgi:hypothetical protein